LSQPHGAEHWANATRLTQNPISGYWRSAHAPVWNHFIECPALVWSAAAGTAAETLAAIGDGKGSRFGLPAPNKEDLHGRLSEELALSLRSLREQTRNYDDRRWKPGKLTPVSDALWRATDGYLDILDASGR
jgi:hypothetical protein